MKELTLISWEFLLTLPGMVIAVNVICNTYHKLISDKYLLRIAFITSLGIIVLRYLYLDQLIVINIPIIFLNGLVVFTAATGLTELVGSRQGTSKSIGTTKRRYWDSWIH